MRFSAKTFIVEVVWTPAHWELMLLLLPAGRQEPLQFHIRLPVHHSDDQCCWKAIHYFSIIDQEVSCDMSETFLSAIAIAQGRYQLFFGKCSINASTMLPCLPS
jgi:hypothetical protein